jgi:hypothetical protein
MRKDKREKRKEKREHDEQTKAYQEGFTAPAGDANGK